MKALIGSWDNRPYQLLAEITALRTRVAELEQALTRAHEDNDLLKDALREHDEAEVVVLSTTR